MTTKNYLLFMFLIFCASLIVGAVVTKIIYG